MSSLFNREILQRLNSLHTQVAPVPGARKGWVRWLIIYPFINQKRIESYINSTDSHFVTEEFRLPALAAGLPSHLLWRVQTENGWIEPHWCFRVRCFEIEQRVLDEHQFGLEGDEAFIVDVVNETTASLDRVAYILASLSLGGETLDYMDEDFPL